MRNKMKWFFPILALVLLARLAVTFTYGLCVGSETGQTEIAPPSLLQTSSAASSIEYREIIHYVEREVIKEVMVEKPIELREFTSLEELETWLADDGTDRYVYLFAGENGIAQTTEEYDCDDYALELQRRAIESGFLMSVTIIEQKGGQHMLNLCCIGNDIYYIEPQTDEVWFYCHKD